MGLIMFGVNFLQ